MALIYNRRNVEAWFKLAFQGGGRVSGVDYSQKECYEQTLELEPNHPLALNNLGLLVAGEGSLDAALDLLRRAQAASVLKSCWPPFLQVNLFGVLTDLGNHDEAAVEKKTISKEELTKYRTYAINHPEDEVVKRWLAAAESQ